METKVALIGIVVENFDSVTKLNDILHAYSDVIIGRMGIPYREKSINIICIAIDAPQDKINSLTGALGKIEGISAKAAYSKN